MESVRRSKRWRRKPRGSVVFIFYTGHGSDSHEIVCYDTDVEDLAGTPLPLGELADTLSRINGTAVLCALDCSFPGGLGSRGLATVSRHLD